MEINGSKANDIKGGKMPYKDKDKQREYQRIWHAKRRHSYFCDKCCKHCGSKEKLELHHLDPSKKEHHSIWSWSEKRRNLEIEKCIVLCKGCHYKAHGKRLGRTCGRVATYKYGCRCELCVVANSEYCKRRRENAKQKQSKGK